MPGAVKLVSKDYPLDQSCNPSLPQTINPAACAAAVAVRLADQHHRRAEMEEWLYSNQQGLTRDTVREAARRVGGVNDFDAQYDTALQGVKADIALGQQLKINSTPTFFVDGIRMPPRGTTEGLQPAGWDEAIRLELKRAGK
jgi:protein-disulfide isomerase